MVSENNTPIKLAWLNTLGGWDFYTFCARKSYAYNSNLESSIQINQFNNWDTDFIDGKGGVEELRINASQIITVRSDQLTVDQISAIARIKYSRKVQDISDLTKPITVGVNKGSLTYYTDKDKRRTIEFTITYPQINIQTG